MKQACLGAADEQHKSYLTPAYRRKGKGGRQPAGDPRLIPGMCPRKARRILANRLSAAKSKQKQKNQVEVGAPQLFTNFGDVAL